MQQPEGEKTIPCYKYVEIKEEKPDTPEKAKWPEFKRCKYTTEAIVSDGIDVRRPLLRMMYRKIGSAHTCDRRDSRLSAKTARLFVQSKLTFSLR